MEYPNISKNNMKLLYITNGINGSGGLERVLSIKASYFAEKLGYEVTILSLNEAHLNPFYQFSEKIKMISIPVGGNPIRYIQAYKKGIQSTVDKVNPNIISVCDDGLKAFFLPSIIKTNAKWIYERHVSKLIEANDNDSFLTQTLNQVKWKLMEVFGNTYHHFVVLTEGNKKEWRSLNNLEVIGNPLSFYPDTFSSLKNKRILVVGRQAYQKGYDYLLNIWSIIESKYPDWKLDVYGKKDSELKLEELKQSLELKNVHFYDPIKEIQNVYLNSSIYWMTSRYEGFGMVLTEAMSYGIPCVSFNCNYGPSDIIQNEIDGYIINDFNLESFAQKTINLIENEELRLKLGFNAKENIHRYAIESIAKQWDNLFKSL